MKDVLSVKCCLNLTEAAALAGVSRPVMIAWANRTDFPALRAGRRWVIPKDALIQWLNDRAGERAEL